MLQSLKKNLVSALMSGSKVDYATLSNQLTVEDAVQKIDEVFGCEQVLEKLHEDPIVPYYQQSEWGYKFYHSIQDSVHFALNFDGVYHPDGYYAQPLAVAEQIEQLNAQKVLEVGCGKGFNSCFLAQKYPQIQFTGVDLTPKHLQIAKRKAQKNNISNLSLEFGNFNQLDVPDQSFDVVFGIECLCYANYPEVLLGELFRVLRPGGRLIVFDGYRARPLEQFSPSLQRAALLMEFSMALQSGFTEIEVWRDTAKLVGFQIQELKDISFAIQPNLLRLQKLSLKFFADPWKAKVLSFFMPKYLVENSIAGLLMGLLFAPRGEVFVYFKSIFQRP